MVNFEMNGEHPSSILEGDRETVFSYSTSWRKITSVDCLCSQLYHRTLMFVSDKKKEEEKRSCNCSNVFERTHNLDPIWHPGQHMFLSQAFRSNVNRRLWALHVVNSSHNGKSKTKIAKSIPNAWLMLLWNTEWSDVLNRRWKSYMLRDLNI